MEDKPKYTVEIDEEIKPTKQAEPGVPWEQMKFKVNAKEFAKLMRDYNIRTAEDVRTNPNTVVRLMQRLYAVDLAAVMIFAQEHEEA